MKANLHSAKLKPIDELIDLDPVISNELLELSRWLAVETLSYEIDALQVMLPAAMRAKYEKFIVVEEPERIEDADFKAFLAGRKRIQLKEVDFSRIDENVKKVCVPRDCYSRYGCRADKLL